MVAGEGIASLLLALRSQGITDAAFLKAVESVPRESFVPLDFRDAAWKNETVPIECGQTLYPAGLMLRMLVALDVQPRHTVLEIGTGSGYGTALLARFARKVVSLERYPALIESAKKRLERLGIDNVAFELRDGRQGGASGGLYDRIVTECAYQDMPRDLLDQLGAGGVVIAAIGPADGEQMLMRLTKVGSRYEREPLFPVRFGAFEAGLAHRI